MTGRIFTVSTLVALAQAKAIITNNCPHPVYIWSVPTVGLAHTDNLPVNPGGRYEEPWRYGTSQHPGIALKVSTQSDGIHTGMDEIDFAYSVDRFDNSNIWVDLSSVRGKTFHNNLAFHTCHGVHKTPDVQTSKCLATDNIELVLCGTARSIPAKDSISFKSIAVCYDNFEDSKTDNSDYTNVESQTVSHSPSSAVCTECPFSKLTSGIPNHQSHPNVPLLTNTACTTTTASYLLKTPTLVTACSTTTVSDHATLTKPKTVTSKPAQYPEHKTGSSSASSKQTPEVYPGPPKHSSNDLYQPPKSLSEQAYSAPPKQTSEKIYPPPKHTTEHPYAPPPKETSEKPYPGPPQATSEEYHEPPKYTTKQPYPPPPQYTSDKPYSRPSHTKEQPYPPPHTTRPYQPPRYTSDSTDDYSVPQRPSYHSQGGRLGPPANPTGNEIEILRPTPTGGNRYGRSALILNTKSKPTYKYCMANVVYENASSQTRHFNGTIAAPRTLTTLPLSVVMRQEAAKHQTAAAFAAQPSINVTTISITAGKPKQCILPFCKPIQSGLHCDEVAKALKMEGENVYDWTDNEDTCSSFLASLKKRARTKVCIKPWCAAFSVPCSDLEDELEELAKDAGMEIDYTTDDSVCPESLASRNKKPASSHKPALSARRVKSTKQAAKVCITPFCKGLSDTDCKKREAQMEQNAKDNVDDIGYTSDPAVCKRFRTLLDLNVQHAADAILSNAQSRLGKRADATYCARAECQLYHLSDTQCIAALKDAEKIAKNAFALDVDYSIDDDVCDQK